MLPFYRYLKTLAKGLIKPYWILYGITENIKLLKQVHHCNQRQETRWTKKMMEFNMESHPKLHDSTPRWFKFLLSCNYNTSEYMKVRPEQGLNPWPLRYRCSALPTELSSQLGPPWSLCEFVIYFTSLYLALEFLPVEGEEYKWI